MSCRVSLRRGLLPDGFQSRLHLSTNYVPSGKFLPHKDLRRQDIFSICKLIAQRPLLITLKPLVLGWAIDPSPAMLNIIEFQEDSDRGGSVGRNIHGHSQEDVFHLDPVASLRQDEEELLASKDKKLWSQIRTTNAIERRFRQVRRRTRPLGIFSDKTSMERILYAVFAYENLKRKKPGPPFLTELTQNS